MKSTLVILQVKFVSQKADYFFFQHFNIKLGIGKEKAMGITQAVQKYGNLSGFGKLQTELNAVDIFS